MRKTMSIISAAAAALPAAIVLPIAAALPILVAVPASANVPIGLVGPTPGIYAGAGGVNYHYSGCYHHERMKGHNHQQADYLCSYLR